MRGDGGYPVTDRQHDASRRETWRHWCITLVRDAAPSWYWEQRKGEPCDQCGITEQEAEARDA